MSESFVVANPQYQTCEGAFDKCTFANKRLQIFLRNLGCHSSMIRMNNFTGKLSKSIHPEWKNFSSEHFTHYAVKSGNYVVDITGIQFGKEYAGKNGVRISKMSTIRREWKLIRELSDNYPFYYVGSKSE